MSRNTEKGSALLSKGVVKGRHLSEIIQSY